MAMWGIFKFGIPYLLSKGFLNQSNSVLSILYFQPPDRVVCPNHEVVMFQPRTGTAPDLGSIDNFTFYNSPPAPPVSTNFLDIFLPPPLSCRPTISSVFGHHPYILHLLPTSYPGAKRRPPGRRPYPPPASLHRSSLCPAPRSFVCPLWV